VHRELANLRRRFIPDGYDPVFTRSRSDRHLSSLPRMSADSARNARPPNMTRSR
jgi:hypothetical protein